MIGYEQAGFATGWLALGSVFSLTLIVVVVAVFDLRERRIPNLIVFPASLLGLCINGLGGGVEGLLFGLKGLGFGFALLFIPYMVKGMKAGDVKFVMAIGSFVGAAGIIRVLLITLLCYPILAAIVVIRESKLAVTWLRFRRILFNFSGFFVSSFRLYAMRLENSDDESVASATTPFGVAIAIGALISIYTRLLISIV
ncbi:MAG: prepilin peptidase [Acidobacteria bacterium]|nr:prepilin peptidase [Acidobacteriota bacterium]